MRNSSCSMPCSSGAGSASCSKPGAVSAPTRLTCWELSVPLIAWSVSARPCAMPSTLWPSSPPSGCGARVSRSGSIAMARGSLPRACPRVKRPRPPTPIPWAKMGAAILAAIYAADAPSWLREVPAVRMLQRVWMQQYYTTAEELRGRTEAEGIPPARVFLSSPYDEEAHLARKDTTQWVGYKVHLTESCDEELPRLITHVETTTGPIADGAVTPVIHH